MAEVTAALITGKETLEFRTFRSAGPPPECVTVDITLCGICGTDVASFRTGHLHSPAVCGHEWVGIIAALGAGVNDLAEGERVIVAVPPPCGRCRECRHGLGEYCRTASSVARGKDRFAPAHGAFAASITVHSGRVLPAHPDLTDEAAAQVEPAAVALHGLRRSRIAPGDTVVVQGAGPIGLLAMQFARAAGAGEVMVIEPAQSRRLLALQLGASAAGEPADATEFVSQHTDGLGADVVIECAGLPSLLQTAADLVRSGGELSLLSFLAQPASINAGRWLANEISVTASNAYTHDDFRRAMTFLADGRVNVGALHSRTIALNDLDEALRALTGGTTDDIKILVNPRPA